MPEEFSARREATKIEKLAQRLEIPQYPIEQNDLQTKLQKELDSLTPAQMRSVGLLVEKEAPLIDRMMGFSNEIIFDTHKNVVGFTFNRPNSQYSVEKSLQKVD